MAAIVLEPERSLAIHWGNQAYGTLLLCNFSGQQQTGRPALPSGSWTKRADSSERQWGGPGSALPLELLGAGPAARELSPQSFALFGKKDATFPLVRSSQ
jgi:hypothetical protein